MKNFIGKVITVQIEERTTFGLRLTPITGTVKEYVNNNVTYCYLETSAGTFYESDIVKVL